MLEILLDPENWGALVTLTILELILGVDNLVFIAILTDRLPRAEQPIGYRLGLIGAMVTRVLLLLALNWILQLTTPLFEMFGQSVSGRDLILLIGGLFLIAKSVHEIYENVEVVEEENEDGNARKGANLYSIVAQIWVMDIIFSLDSVITAVGMANDVEIMIFAIVFAVILMLVAARPIGNFINRHPSTKILALAFMLLIGVLLVAEGCGQHVSKAYVYCAMGFAFFVELLNMRLRNRSRKGKTGTH